LIFNLQKNVFTLYNDTGILEFSSIYEVYKYITIEQLKKNNKPYFYPVLLVYCKENIYEEQTIVLLKKTNKINYELLLDECDKLIKEDNQKEKPLTEEEKRRNYNELLLAQIKYERTNREKNNAKENDDILQFLRNNEKDYSEVRKMNIIDNDLKKNNSNNYLQNNKTSKKDSKFYSVEQRSYSKRCNNFNVGSDNYNFERRFKYSYYRK
jgi:hypothetical protein